MNPRTRDGATATWTCARPDGEPRLRPEVETIELVEIPEGAEH